MRGYPYLCPPRYCCLHKVLPRSPHGPCLNRAGRSQDRPAQGRESRQPETSGAAAALESTAGGDQSDQRAKPFPAASQRRSTNNYDGSTNGRSEHAPEGDKFASKRDSNGTRNSIGARNSLGRSSQGSRDSQAELRRCILSAVELTQITREVELLRSLRHECASRSLLQFLLRRPRPLQSVPSVARSDALPPLLPRAGVVEFREYFISPSSSRIHIVLEVRVPGLGVPALCSYVGSCCQSCQARDR